MPKLTYEQLTTTVTVEEATTELLTTLQTLGFQTDAWQTGGVQRSLLHLVAVVYVLFAEAAATLTKLGFNSTATGTGLTQLSASHFGNTRIAAAAAEYTIRLTGAASGPPHSPGVGEVIVTDGTRTYANKAAFIINASSTADVVFVAQAPGTDSNVAASAIATLQTPLSGVSIDTANNVLTTAGVDAETDAELRVRNAAKWGDLSVEVVRASIESVALAASKSIRRVAVDDNNPRGDFTVDIYLAGSTSAVGDTELDAMVTAFAQRAMGVVSKDSSADPLHFLVKASAEQTVPVEGTIYIESTADADTVKAAAESAVKAIINTSPIGGKDLGPVGPTNVLPRNDLIAAIEALDNVVSVSLSQPTTETVSIGAFAVPVAGAVSFTMAKLTR